MKHTLFVAGLAALLALGVPRPVRSCGYHGVVTGLRAIHPRSLQVTFGIQDACAAGRLQPIERIPSEAGLSRTKQLMEKLPQTSAADPHSPFSPTPGEAVSILLVDQGLWSRLSHVDGHIALQFHVDAPTPGDRVIVTGEAPLQALVEHQWTVDHLLNMQVLAIDDPKVGHASR